ncbi:RTA1 like protein-domain-containing protein [Ilyonectria robusta]|uniref:RTA1 like protein-domain-containing protein n=1 Tax=Ilyonectria robusta TaxID=1079257 RepID=UPI001E8E8A1E|nr:RTA1 like protein-domain-containing protein [Ilyonectria robusta]KAH8734127.1 RTA1 like protein-domain-containing protein [Ilyonectria robusta]
MSSTHLPREEPGEFVFYHYDPSLAAAIIFIVLFGISALLHLWQVIKLRSWYFIPFLIGCIFEIVGYIGRAMSATETPNWSTRSFTIQSLTLLLGPALLAASIYMVLGRLIRLLNAEHLSPINPKWLTKLFVLGDVLSFLTQGGGGAILARAKSMSDVKLGENVIIAGLAIQIAFFGVFIVVICLFHYRILASPTSSWHSSTMVWQRFLWILYAASVLIMIRSVFRVAEYVMGNDGALLANEVYLYVFDAALMFVVAAMFNYFHPGKIIQTEDKSVLTSENDNSVDMYSLTARPSANQA